VVMMTRRRVCSRGFVVWAREEGARERRRGADAGRHRRARRHVAATGAARDPKLALPPSRPSLTTHTLSHQHSSHSNITLTPPFSLLLSSVRVYTHGKNTTLVPQTPFFSSFPRRQTLGPAPLFRSLCARGVSAALPDWRAVRRKEKAKELEGCSPFALSLFLFLPP
jgi:hypothetical protein